MPLRKQPCTLTELYNRHPNNLAHATSFGAASMAYLPSKRAMHRFPRLVGFAHGSAALLSVQGHELANETPQP